MKTFFQFNLYAAYYMLLAFLPLGWITLMNIGTLSLKLMHLSMVPLLICLLFKPFREKLVKFISANKYIIGFFTLLMVLNFVSTSFNVTRSPTASSYITKNLVYFSLFLLFGALIIMIARSPNFYAHIALSNAIGLLMFVAIATISFKAMGRSFLLDLVNFFLKGDSNALRYTLFRTLFNSAENSGDADQSTNLLNTLIGSFIFINFTALYAYHNTKSKFLNAVNIFCLAFTFFIIIASVSRSNTLALILGYVMYWIFDIVFNNNKKRILHLISFFCLFVLFILLFWTRIEDAFSGASTMIAGRFADLDDNARWAINAECINSFTRNFHNFIIGKGSGAIVLDDLTAHNFILGSAFQAGIGGFVLSSLFYFGLIFSLAKNARFLATYKNALLICSLMIIPLLRTMESGGSGSMTLQEWFCVAFFLGFVLQKKKEQINI